MAGGVPLIDFSPLGDLGKTYNQARLQAGREQSLAALQQGASVDDVAKSLLASGDIEGGMSLARLGEAQAQRQEAAARDARDFQFRQDEAKRTQANADRSFGLQERMATEKPSYQTLDDGQGNKRLYRIDPLGGAVTDVTPGGPPAAPSNPYAPGGKFTESQAKDALYASRMFNAERVLRDPKVIGAATDMGQQGRSKVPIIGNYLVSGDYQKYDQAQRDFINAVLRRESGAVIADSEFENAAKQYFPQPGDTSEKLAQKQQNRAEAIRGIAAGAGAAYRPAYVFDDKGDIVANPAPQRNAPPAAPATPGGQAPAGGARRSGTTSGKLPAGVTKDGALAEARAAIAQGRDQGLVKARLQSFGIDPSEL